MAKGLGIPFPVAWHVLEMVGKVSGQSRKGRGIVLGLQVGILNRCLSYTRVCFTVSRFQTVL